MSIIAVANQKGGVGKTNTTITLGHGLALRGYRVLLVDLDTQGHLAVGLGLKKGYDLVEWLRGQASLKQAACETGRQNLNVIRSDASTADFKVEMAGRRFREQILARALNVPHSYDVILLDCAPSRDVLLDAAIMAADWLLAPAKMDQLSSDGLVEILNTLSEMRGYGAQCELLAIIPTMYDRRETESITQLDALVAGFNQRIWPTILTDSRVKVANRHGQTLWELTGKCRALAGYLAVLDELEKRIR